jgi:hypothetical protein
MRTFRLIRICFSEAYSRACVVKHLFDNSACSERCQATCFIIVTFELYFGIHHEEGPREQRVTGIE